MMLLDIFKTLYEGCKIRLYQSNKLIFEGNIETVSFRYMEEIVVKLIPIDLNQLWIWID